MNKYIYLKWCIGYKKGQIYKFGSQNFIVVKVYRRTFWRAFFKGLGFNVYTMGIKIKRL